jgi:hypothetical protein
MAASLWFSCDTKLTVEVVYVVMAAGLLLLALPAGLSVPLVSSLASSLVKAQAAGQRGKADCC